MGRPQVKTLAPIPVDEAQHEAIRQAAKVCGLPVRGFVLRAAVDCAASVLGTGPGSMADQVRAIHAAICGTGNGQGRPAEPVGAQEAIAALVTLGLGKSEATAKVAKARVQNVDAPTEELVRLALKREP